MMPSRLSVNMKPPRVDCKWVHPTLHLANNGVGASAAVSASMGILGAGAAAGVVGAGFPSIGIFGAGTDVGAGSLGTSGGGSGAGGAGGSGGGAGGSGAGPGLDSFSCRSGVLPPSCRSGLHHSLARWKMCSILWVLRRSSYSSSSEDGEVGVGGGDGDDHGDDGPAGDGSDAIAPPGTSAALQHLNKSMLEALGDQKVMEQLLDAVGTWIGPVPGVSVLQGDEKEQYHAAALHFLQLDDKLHSDAPLALQVARLHFQLKSLQSKLSLPEYRSLDAFGKQPSCILSPCS
jgi:hypothetical protein